MKNLNKLRGFIFHQIFFSLIIVFICTFVSSIISYQVLRGKMSNWLTENNNKVLEQYSGIVNTRIVANASDTYQQVLNDILTISSVGYYLALPLDGNILDTLKVSKYLKSIKESNPIISSVAIFYANNNLLISSDMIRHDLHYEERKEELKPYSYTLNSTMALNNTFYSIVEQDTLCMTRPIITSGNASALFVINYSLDTLREILQDGLPSGFGDLFVFDAKGISLFSTNELNDTNRIFTDTLLAKFDTKSHGITTIIEKINNIHCIISYKNIGDMGWVYVILTPMDVYMKPIDYILKSLSVTVGFTLLIGVILAITMLLWQTKPVYSIVGLCELANVETHEDKNTYKLIKDTLTGLINTIRIHNKERERIMPVLRDNFLTRLLAEITITPAEIEDNISLMGIEFLYKNFCIIAAKSVVIADNKSEFTDEFELEYALAEIRLQFEEVFNSNDCFSKFYKKDTVILGFINFDYSENDFNSLCYSLSDIKIYNTDSRYEIYICSGEVVQNIANIAGSVKDIINGLEYSYIFPESNYLTISKINSFTKARTTSAFIYLRNFISHIRTGDFEDSISEFDKFVKQVQEDICEIDMLDRLVYAAAVEMEGVTSLDSNFSATFLQAYKESVNITDFYNTVRNQIIDLKEISNNLVDKSFTDKLIIKAKKYISNNFSNVQFSLQATAEAINTSPTYLSRIFSERENITFVKYVTCMKMEYGRKLLLETDLSLEEISIKLNYASPQYFISRFKEHFNITPSVYRKNYKYPV